MGIYYVLSQSIETTLPARGERGFSFAVSWKSNIGLTPNIGDRVLSSFGAASMEINAARMMIKTIVIQKYMIVTITVGGVDLSFSSTVMFFPSIAEHLYIGIAANKAPSSGELDAYLSKQDHIIPIAHGSRISDLHLIVPVDRKIDFSTNLNCLNVIAGGTMTDDEDITSIVSIITHIFESLVAGSSLKSVDLLYNIAVHGDIL